MGIEPTLRLKTKRLPEAGGTIRSALEAVGTIIGRKLDVDDCWPRHRSSILQIMGSTGIQKSTLNECPIETVRVKKQRAVKPKADFTARQRKFVTAFKGNATEAAIAAGYKPSSARILGSRLLATPSILRSDRSAGFRRGQEGITRASGYHPTAVAASEPSAGRNER
jgi:hypothetical protein